MSWRGERPSRHHATSRSRATPSVKPGSHRLVAALRLPAANGKFVRRHRSEDPFARASFDLAGGQCFAHELGSPRRLVPSNPSTFSAYCKQGYRRPTRRHSSSTAPHILRLSLLRRVRSQRSASLAARQIFLVPFTQFTALPYNPSLQLTRYARS